MRTTTEKEPVQVTETIPPETVEQYIARVEAESVRFPDGFFPLGICRHCGASLGSAPEDKVIPIGCFGYLPNVCCQPCSDKGRARLALEDAQARAAMYSSKVPAEFVFWDDEKGNKRALAAVLGKFSFSSRRGLILFGPSGTCKTRLLWEIVKRVVDQPDNFTWLFMDSYDAAVKGVPEEAAFVQFLFLDDLGNEPTSTKFETALLRLIKRRNDWHKPTFITTQLTGAQFKGRFFQGPAAVAIMRRLRERSDQIATDFETAP